MARELTDEEKKAYDHMLEGAKQLNIFGEEEELDAKDFFIYPLDNNETEIPL
ncbi:hypothetical protein [Butyrivibrio sp. INlla16]|uniref:hypothetical protein n=1 Tax=Butyrivibrio sp. INlla16 TaxID=1520807 RepID=UPI00088FBE69|nr:hypothetical protein [Butyrivibrio sp. INlla16]SDB56786.1 hypothetical protein SAMN02910263_02901 [Butyrivibrio sp. INlla16]